MPSEKRARQRANRRAKEAQEAKQARRQLIIKRTRRIVFYGIIIAIVLFLASLVWGGNGDEQSLGLLLGA